MRYSLALLLLFVCACRQNKASAGNAGGDIEKQDNELWKVIDSTTKIEVIADGCDWAEGPLWIDAAQMLLFSDVPQNVIYKWSEAKGKELYVQPSGYTGHEERGGEPGSNGLALNSKGELVLCQHGNRQVAVMNAPLHTPKPFFTALANRYNDKLFNSPNDLVLDARGNIYFTDPPYGLEGNMDDSTKQLPFQGVYSIGVNGKVTLLIDSISRPNGIALTPDGRHLFIANSDPKKAYWYRYDILPNGTLANGTIFYDATTARIKEEGNPDGLKIDRQGNVFASGPGGLWIFNRDGKILGKIKFSERVSNCALSTDEKVLYITADSYVLRVQLRQ